jgi:tRNA dimethylallyltransferase
MYLNAILLDVPLAPKVEASTRRAAERLTAGAPNPRRAARAKELELAGAVSRRSIWEGEPRYDTAIIYLRPDRAALDAAIARRSEKILHHGLEEAAQLVEMQRASSKINASVADSIGVRELVEHLSRRITAKDAKSLINTRTRQLARRQTRWFDKLVRSLEGRVPTTIVHDPYELNTMHDRIWA